MKKLGIFGSTGSIGRSCLEVVRNHPGRLSVSVLTANSNASLLIKQALEFKPDVVVIVHDRKRAEVQKALSPSGVKVLSGEDGLVEAAGTARFDMMVGGITGFAGLRPTLESIRAGRDIGLANKETLVVAGRVVKDLLEKHRVRLIPIDSEHSAIFQCIMGEDPSSIDYLMLTASGGPFLHTPAESFGEIDSHRALKHPTWNMGNKITIDSATLMNKGLEVIEAHWLFDLDFDRIQVVVHPQSIIHSMVAFTDGSIKAQLGLPDMKIPIQFALSYPERWESPYERVDFSAIGQLDFLEPDTSKFKCLSLAYECGRKGGTAPAVLNAANEEAVHLFLEDRIKFVDIPETITRVLEKHDILDSPDLHDILEADAWARKCVPEVVKSVGAAAYTK